MRVCVCFADHARKRSSFLPSFLHRCVCLPFSHEATNWTPPAIRSGAMVVQWYNSGTRSDDGHVWISAWMRLSCRCPARSLSRRQYSANNNNYSSSSSRPEDRIYLSIGVRLSIISTASQVIRAWNRNIMEAAASALLSSSLPYTYA